MSIGSNIIYFTSSTYRRKLLDKMHARYGDCYHGTVLDIGGRDRGNFRKPKEQVEKWIFADIEQKHNPDIILDVTNMSQINDGSIDVISALELFEHVSEINKGLSECFRVLKERGVMLVSMPFLYPVHADPFDYQRWTKDKWETELKKVGFTVEKIEVMGCYFTVLADMLKNLNKSMPRPVQFAGYVFTPLLDLMTRLDSFDLIKKNRILGSYTNGYFMLVRKP